MNWSHTDKSSIQPRLRRSGAELASYISVFFGLASVLFSLVITADQRQWGLAGAWCAALFIPGAFFYVASRKPRYGPPRDTSVFRPFGELRRGDIWPRDRELSTLTAALKDNSHVALVVGPSGVGKSVLLKLMLPPTLSCKPGCYRYLSSYGPSPELEKLPSGPEYVIVLDQFEQHLAWLRDRAGEQRQVDERWLRDLLRERVLAGTKIVISVRNEWYWDLRFLKDLLPAISEVVEVTAPEAKPASPAREKIVSQFVNALQLDENQSAELIVDALDQDGSLLPLEVQIVGATLERARRDDEIIGLEYLMKNLGGVAGAINAYFEEILRGAPAPLDHNTFGQLLPHDNRRVTLKVLCALSVRTRFRKRERMDVLLNALFEDRAAVKAAIEYLVEQKIVVPVRSGYELAHDYLAEVFHQESAAELDPTDRDNIEFHIETPQEKTNDIVLTRNDRERRQQRRSWALYTIAGLAVLMTARLLYFGIDWYLFNSGPHARPLIGGRLLDETYLPIYLAHLSWAIYLGLFYHRIFRYLHERGIARILSVATIAVIPPMAIAAMLIPSAWILSIAACGFVVGIKMLSLGRTKRINVAARARMENMGQITTVNMIMAGLIGGVALGLSIVAVHGESGTNYWTIAMVMWSMVLVFACLALVTAHVGRRAAALTLGLLARPVGSASLER